MCAESLVCIKNVYPKGNTAYPEIVRRYHKLFRSKVKSKAIPLQAWTGPGGSSRLRLPDFKTLDS